MKASVNQMSLRCIRSEKNILFLPGGFLSLGANSTNIPLIPLLVRNPIFRAFFSVHEPFDSCHVKSLSKADVDHYEAPHNPSKLEPTPTPCLAAGKEPNISSFITFIVGLFSSLVLCKAGSSVELWHWWSTTTSHEDDDDDDNLPSWDRKGRAQSQS